jgi:hypothetical protein
MTRVHRGFLTAAVVTMSVLLACGCAKKDEPAAPAKAPTAAEVPTTTDATAKEAVTQAPEAPAAKQGMPVFNAGAIIAQVDKNGDGKVSRAEYDAIWRDKATAERNFKAFDKNGDGVLTAEEFTPNMGAK